MTKISNSLAILAVGGLMLASSAAAQSTTSNTSGAGPGVVDPHHPRVNQVNRREANQQKRIANGVKNGTLTSKQASHLERRERQSQQQIELSRIGSMRKAAESCGFSL